MRRNLIQTPLLMVAYLVFVVFFLHTSQPLLLAGWILGFAALVVLVFVAYRVQSWVGPAEGGLELHWHIPFRTTVVPWEQIRNPKITTLRAVFPKEKDLRRVDDMTRGVLDKPAVVFRLHGSAEDLAALAKRLGRRYVMDGQLVLPISAANNLVEEVSQRLPSRAVAASPNRGGARRPRRRH